MIWSSGEKATVRNEWNDSYFSFIFSVYPHMTQWQNLFSKFWCTSYNEHMKWYNATVLPLIIWKLKLYTDWRMDGHMHQYVYRSEWNRNYTLLKEINPWLETLFEALFTGSIVKTSERKHFKISRSVYTEMVMLVCLILWPAYSTPKSYAENVLVTWGCMIYVVFIEKRKKKIRIS